MLLISLLYTHAMIYKLPDILGGIVLLLPIQSIHVATYKMFGILSGNKNMICNNFGH